MTIESALFAIAQRDCKLEFKASETPGFRRIAIKFPDGNGVGSNVYREDMTDENVSNVIVDLVAGIPEDVLGRVGG